MLTTEVKNKINTCRDILVGKLPDPKSQVLQITNALIYKFMDDQDRMAEKLGGKSSFFIKELESYAWHKLFDSKLSNQDRADKYTEGLEKLSKAKHLPDLFQEIFKEAYVPFRAAGTIVMFIDEINKFDYHHSEELGNAYEYLLSIMGSQGDAGQFRTPRHIIEFIVDIVDPKKNETIHDPAAGTAGFLIAAYKHILEENKKLTSNDRNKLSKNISGIDISPDMAKMARVNLYLHGFTTPNIEEGDTLSDENLWEQKYDVILANPPFMSPKGGIVPHDKFNIKAKRSEVLFADYIAEHLKLKGRAGMIVPEGIIFQSGANYKDLRKMLVNDGYLTMVISLPAGVFQPYSGVKTSILIMDRENAKEAEEILFLKIDNDGHSLGTQRTEIEGSQMPETLAIARAWQNGKKKESTIASWVSKKEITDSDDYTLTNARYRAFETQTSSWSIVELKECCEVIAGQSPDGKYYNVSGKGIPFYQGKTEFGDHYIGTPAKWTTKTTKLSVIGDILMSVRAPVGPINKNNYGEICIGRGLAAIRPTEKVLTSYLYAVLKPISEDLKGNGGAVFDSINKAQIEKIKIPLPPIDVQQEIVAELDRYQKIIDGARQVVQNYKPSFKINQDWQKVKLGNLAKNLDGKRKPVTKSDRKSGKYPYYGASGIVDWVEDYIFDDTLLLISEDGANLLARSTPIAFSVIGKVWVNNHAHVLKFDNQTTQTFVETYINSIDISEYVTGAAQPKLNQKALNSIEIPLASKSEQSKIVKALNSELDSVNASKKLIEIFEKKIQDRISEVWGE